MFSGFFFADSHPHSRLIWTVRSFVSIFYSVRVIWHSRYIMFIVAALKAHYACVFSTHNVHASTSLFTLWTFGICGLYWYVIPIAIAIASYNMRTHFFFLFFFLAQHSPAQRTMLSLWKVANNKWKWNLTTIRNVYCWTLDEIVIEKELAQLTILWEYLRTFCFALLPFYVQKFNAHN